MENEVKCPKCGQREKTKRILQGEAKIHYFACFASKAIVGPKFNHD